MTELIVRTPGFFMSTDIYVHCKNGANHLDSKPVPTQWKTFYLLHSACALRVLMPFQHFMVPPYHEPHSPSFAFVWTGSPINTQLLKIPMATTIVA